MANLRTPVWLVTGYLGAGKTTLLTRWLAEPALAHAALVINEVGEVGLDDRLLARAVDSASLVSNACICCTGLPGLEQALADLWWDRLHRRRPAFDAVVIETTGLADPGPVIAALQADPFLAARYALAGVVTVVSATTGWPALAAHPEALAQVQNADLLVVTKVDRADPAAWRQRLQAEYPRAAVACSAQASLPWREVQGLVAHRRTDHADTRKPSDDQAPPASSGPCGDDGDEGHLLPQPHGRHAHDHAHGAQARFIASPIGLDRENLARWAETQRAPALLRLKGVLQSADGHLFMAQWALGDAAVSLVGFEGPAPRLGLTCIA